MPHLAKRHLSQYVRRACQARLRFDLYNGSPELEVLVGPDGEPVPNPPPKRETTRPGLPLLAEEGRRSEQERYEELAAIFPRHTSRPEPGDARSRVRPGDNTRFYRLEDVWQSLLVAPCFLIETEYQVPQAFRDALGLDGLVAQALSNRPNAQALSLGNARPDVIQALPPAAHGAENDQTKPVAEVLASGDTRPIRAGDERIGLRVIDCKLAAEASEAHFAEIAYYCMTLAAWLEATGDEGGQPLSRRFFVRADSAVWPGRHGGSSMARLNADRRREGEDPSDEENLTAFAADLDYLPTAVFTARVRRFFQDDLVRALGAADWKTLEYHVDTRCVGCEYLGHHWGRTHEDDRADGEQEEDERRLRYCKPRARKTGHPSRLPGMTSGARRALARQGVGSIAEIAARDARDPVYDVHSALKGMRAVAPERARILGTRAAALVAGAGATAILPSHADIKIHVVVEFDPASGITGALGYKVDYWRGPRDRGNVQIAREKSLDAERNALVAMLTDIHARLLQAQNLPWTNRDGRPKQPTAQVYFWDRIGYEHLRRVVGRHLAALVATPQLRNLAWLFPPEQVIPNPSSISLRSPVSIVAEAFRGLTAVDAPHFYSLLDCARFYHPEWVDRYGRMGEFRVHGLFRDPLTDYVPVERIHELWQDEHEINARNLARLRRHQKNPADYRPLPLPHAVAENLSDTIRTKLTALAAVAERLTAELRPRLEASAPVLGPIVRGRGAESGISADGLVWLEHRRLQAAADRFENDMLRAMTSEQREAKFECARLTRALGGEDREAALQVLGLQDPGTTRLVFEMSAGSRDVKMKEGMGWSLLTEALLPFQYATLSEIADPGREWAHMVPHGLRRLLGEAPHKPLFEATKVNVAGLDRSRRLVAVDADAWPQVGGEPFLLAALRHGFMALPLETGLPEEGWAALDRVVTDFATGRIEAALRGVENPPLANTRPRVGLQLLPSILGPTTGPRGPRRTQPNAAERFLWDADRLSREASRFDAAPGLANPATGAASLTPRQRDALQNSLTRRLSLVWGPPGTGKSRTCRAMLACLAEWSSARDRRVRVLVTGPTWTAIDNVAEGMPRILAGIGHPLRHSIYRLKSASRDDSSVAPDLRNLICPTAANDVRFQNLLDDLRGDAGFVLVAATPHQVARLVQLSGLCPEGRLRADMFDFVLIDEASQLDVAHTVMAYSALAPDCCVAVVGDDKQMPPIQPVPPPVGLETMVGSIYDYYRTYAEDAVRPIMLNLNYRSNSDIVDFVRAAGYDDDFSAQHADQRVRLVGTAPGDGAPAGWPPGLDWNPEWGRLLDPAEPLVAVLHGDDMAGQSNEAEAHAVAAMVGTLWRRLGGMTGGRPEAMGDGAPLDLDAFLRRGVGVVTPHRAQQATIVTMLEGILPRDFGFEGLYESVDTVERFQGQERMVMIASLGLGDLDQIRGEEEFLYSLNRFNVIASRAQAKFILVASRALIDHIPSDPKVMRQSALIKHFADGFLRDVRRAELPRLGTVEIRTRPRRT